MHPGSAGQGLNHLGLEGPKLCLARLHLLLREEAASELTEQSPVPRLGPEQVRVETAQLPVEQVLGEEVKPLEASRLDQACEQELVQQRGGARTGRGSVESLCVGIGVLPGERASPGMQDRDDTIEVLEIPGTNSGVTMTAGGTEMRLLKRSKLVR